MSFIVIVFFLASIMLVPNSIIFFILTTPVEREALTVVKYLMYLPPNQGNPVGMASTPSLQLCHPRDTTPSANWLRMNGFSFCTALCTIHRPSGLSKLGDQNCVTMIMLWLSHSSQKSRFPLAWNEDNDIFHKLILGSSCNSTLHNWVLYKTYEEWVFSWWDDYLSLDWLLILGRLLNSGFLLHSLAERRG